MVLLALQSPYLKELKNGLDRQMAEKAAIGEKFTDTDRSTFLKEFLAHLMTETGGFWTTKPTLQHPHGQNILEFVSFEDLPLYSEEYLERDAGKLPSYQDFYGIFTIMCHLNEKTTDHDKICMPRQCRLNDIANELHNPGSTEVPEGYAGQNKAAWTHEIKHHWALVERIDAHTGQIIYLPGKKKEDPAIPLEQVYRHIATHHIQKTSNGQIKHVGRDRTWKNIKKSFGANGIQCQIVKDFVNACPGCKERQGVQSRARGIKTTQENNGNQGPKKKKRSHDEYDGTHFDDSASSPKRATKKLCIESDSNRIQNGRRDPTSVQNDTKFTWPPFSPNIKFTSQAPYACYFAAPQSNATSDRHYDASSGVPGATEWNQIQRLLAYNQQFEPQYKDTAPLPQINAAIKTQSVHPSDLVKSFAGYLAELYQGTRIEDHMDVTVPELLSGCTLSDTIEAISMYNRLWASTQEAQPFDDIDPKLLSAGNCSEPQQHFQPAMLYSAQPGGLEYTDATQMDLEQYSPVREQFAERQFVEFAQPFMDPSERHFDGQQLPVSDVSELPSSGLTEIDYRKLNDTGLFLVSQFLSNVEAGHFNVPEPVEQIESNTTDGSFTEHSQMLVEKQTQPTEALEPNEPTVSNIIDASTPLDPIPTVEQQSQQVETLEKDDPHNDSTSKENTGNDPLFVASKYKPIIRIDSFDHREEIHLEDARILKEMAAERKARAAAEKKKKEDEELWKLMEEELEKAWEEGQKTNNDAECESEEE